MNHLGMREQFVMCSKIRGNNLIYGVGAYCKIEKLFHGLVQFLPNW